MYAILIIRDTILDIYNRFNFILRPVLKFAAAFIILFVLQSKAGYFEPFSRLVSIAAASFFCAFFPPGCISFVAGVFLIADMVSLSYAMAVFGAGSLLLIFILYYGFKPGTGIIISIVPLSFAFNIPFTVPILLGMTLGLHAVIPAALGVFIWNMIRYFIVNADKLAAESTVEIAESFIEIASAILSDGYMVLIIAAYVLTVIAVSIISSSSMNYSWTTAVITGAIISGALFIAGDIMYSGRPLLNDILGFIVSMVIVVIYKIAFFSVDYRSTERLRFEDDEYIYYVKAVPKIDPYKDDYE